MANIIRLADYQQTRRSQGAASAEGATIHLFLGVRYERFDGPSEPASPSRSTRSKGARKSSRKRA